MSLPETYASPDQMARALASYIPCPKRIRFEVLCAFSSAPHADQIMRYRAQHLTRPAPESPAFKPHDGHYPAEAYARADDANRRFVGRLLAARGA